MKQVKLVDVTDEIVKQLWESGRSDHRWPEPSGSETGFAAFVEEWQAAAVMGLGKMMAVRTQISGPTEEQIRGFVTFHVLDPMWSTADYVVVECGTYLLPPIRGQGWNRAVKAASLSHAAVQFGADAVVYVVPEDNLPAIRSLERMVGEYRVSSMPAKATASELENILKRWLSYRAWKEGKPFRLFVIPLESA